MRLIIEAHLIDDEGSTERIQLATIDRNSTTDPLGMSLAEGKALLASAQQHLVNSQCQGIASAHAHCEHCDASLGLKGWHQRQIKTVFDLVNVQSPWVRHCRCANKPAGASFSHLSAGTVRGEFKSWRVYSPPLAAFPRKANISEPYGVR